MVEKKESEKIEAKQACKLVNIPTGYANAFQVGDQTMTIDELLVDIYNKLDFVIKRIG